MAHFRNFQVCHECATKILFDFINIEKRYKRKNPANRWICRVYRFFRPFLKTLKILFFLCFRAFAEKEGFEPPDLLQSTVFKTAAFDRSAISPVCCYHLLIASANIVRFFDYKNFFCPFLMFISNKFSSAS